MDKLSWKDKMWLVMEGIGFALLYLSVPVLIILVILDMLFRNP